MSDDAELADFRAENEESQYNSQYTSQQAKLADPEVQQRWSEWVDLLLKQQRRVQGGATIQEIYR